MRRMSSPPSSSTSTKFSASGVVCESPAALDNWRRARAGAHLDAPPLGAGHPGAGGRPRACPDDRSRSGNPPGAAGTSVPHPPAPQASRAVAAAGAAASEISKPIMRSPDARRAPVLPVRAVRLARGDLWASDRRPGPMRIGCAAGAVWVTQTGQRGDVELTVGEMCETAPRGKVVVCCLEDALVLLDGAPDGRRGEDELVPRR
jgi:hypothetical protein